MKKKEWRGRGRRRGELEDTSYIEMGKVSAPSRANLVPQYAPAPGSPATPPADPMNTMMPDFLARKCGRIARVVLMTPNRFVLNCLTYRSWLCIQSSFVSIGTNGKTNSGLKAKRDPPNFLHHAPFNISRIVDQHINPFINPQRLGDSPIDLRLRGRDIEVQHGCPRFFQRGEALGAVVTGSGYGAVPAGENGADKELAEAGGAARDEPGELGHCCWRGRWIKKRLAGEFRWFQGCLWQVGGCFSIRLAVRC